jgi:hypothetical protein
VAQSARTLLLFSPAGSDSPSSTTGSESAATALLAWGIVRHCLKVNLNTIVCNTR